MDTTTHTQTPVEATKDLTAAARPPVRAEFTQQPPINGQQKGAVLNVDDPVRLAEYEFLIRAFEELRTYGDAELRISIAKEPKGSETEIIYAGIHKKKSLEPLRRVYRARTAARNNRPPGVIRA